MNGSPRDPPRWKSRADQSDLAERAAGQAFRLAAAAPRQPAPPISRVAARIRSSRPPRRLAWAMATTAFVLGVATAASATHLDQLRVWLTNIIMPRTDAPARPGTRRTRGMSPSSRPQVQPSPPQVEPLVAPPTTTPPASVPMDTTTPTRPTTAAAPTPPVAARATAGARTSTPVHASPTRRPASASTLELALVERGQTEPSRSSTSASHPASAPHVASPAPQPMPLPRVPELMPSPWPAPASSPAPARSGRSPVARVPPGRSPASAPPPQVPAPTPQGAGRYLAETIQLLRKERAPAPALQLLDDHDRELAQAGFRHEALILRVEALLALDRRAEVLRLLDRSALSDVAASRALLVTRGELRAAANRCAEGIGDFELVLARSRQVDRQALAGRALCRKRLGLLAGARADIQRLREAFPNEPLPGGLAE